MFVVFTEFEATRATRNQGFKLFQQYHDQNLKKICFLLNPAQGLVPFLDQDFAKNYLRTMVSPMRPNMRRLMLESGIMT
jgi:hypothetical protein